MTTKGYSKDLRERVIEHIRNGNTQVSTAKRFSINISTANRWYLRYRREGSFLAKKRPGAKIRIDLEGLIKRVGSNPEMKLKELGKEFGVSLWAIYYWLNKLGFSYKKKPLSMWKQVKKSEQDTLS